MRHIRKGTSRVTIPFQLRSTSKVMAQWANQVRQGLLELRDRIPQANTGRGGGGGGTPAPFWASVRTKAGSTPESPVYEITVSLGYVTYQNVNSSDVVGYIVPTIAGVKLDANLENPDIEIPGITISGMVNYVYLNVKTNADGDPKLGESDVSILVSSEIQESTHHVRPSPSGGETEGDYYFLIADTEQVPDSDPPRPRIRRRITGNRFIPNQLIEIANIKGDGDESKQYELYEGYLPGAGSDKHQFRTLEQVGEGEPIIKPLDPGSPAVPPQLDPSGNVIKPGEPAVPPESQGETIRFKSISGKSPNQINVESQEDTIEISGNNYGIFVSGGVREISVSDGLVTQVTGFTSGSDLDMNLIGLLFTGPSSSPTREPRGKLYFRDGRLVSAADKGDDPAGLQTQEIIVDVSFIS